MISRSPFNSGNHMQHTETFDQQSMAVDIPYASNEEFALKKKLKKNTQEEDEAQSKDKGIIPKSDISSIIYYNWENISNLCWLDASMALIANNQTLRYNSNLKDGTNIQKIIKHYNEAICILNYNYDKKYWDIEHRLSITRYLLKTVQNSSVKFLKPILKFEDGNVESAFCALLNLIQEDESITKYFEVKYTKLFSCEKCKKTRTINNKKCIITLPNTAIFKPSSPFFSAECPSCRLKNQQIQVSYQTLPKCLIFHFTNGAGQCTFSPLDFTIKGRDYKVTGLMTLKQSEKMTVGHFVSWIRDPISNFWLKCDDLERKILKFAALPLNCINLADVCMIMFEAFDDLGIIEIKTDVSELTKKQNLQDEADDANIPLIDLSKDIETSSYTVAKYDNKMLLSTDPIFPVEDKNQMMPKVKEECKAYGKSSHKFNNIQSQENPNIKMELFEEIMPDDIKNIRYKKQMSKKTFSLTTKNQIRKRNIKKKHFQLKKCVINIKIMTREEILKFSPHAFDYNLKPLNTSCEVRNL